MVRKYGKHGIESGHTFRAFRSKFHRRYRRNAVLVWRFDTIDIKGSKEEGETVPVEKIKSISRDDNEFELFDETMTFSKDVSYSMNKRNRWLIPDMIRDQFQKPNRVFDYDIYTHKDDENEDVNTCSYSLNETQFEVVERNAIRKNDSCTGILSWTSDEVNNVYNICEKNKSRGYFQPDNMLHTPALFSRNTRRWIVMQSMGSLGKDTKIPGSLPRTRVRLEISNPVGENAAAQLKPWTLGFDTRKYFECDNCLRRPNNRYGYSFRRGFQKQKGDLPRRQTIMCHTKPKQNKIDGEYGQRHSRYEPKRAVVTLFDYIYPKLPKTCKGGILDTCDHDLSAIFNEENSEINADNSVNANEEHKTNEEDSTTTFSSDFPPLPVVEQTKLGLKIDQSEKKSAKVKQEKVKVFKDVPNLIDEYNERKDMKYVNVVIDRTLISPQYLSSHYGERYIECKCTPRRFLIDISESVASSCKNDNKDETGNSKTMAWLVFELNTNNEGVHDQEQVFKVAVNLSLLNSNAVTKIGTIPDTSKLTIKEVISNTLRYIEDTPSLNVELSMESANLQVTQTNSLLHETSKWVSKSYLPSKTLFMEALFSNQNHGTNLMLKRRSKSNLGTSRENSFIDGGLGLNSDRSTVCEICLLIMEYTSGSISLNACGHQFCYNCWEEYLKTCMEYKVSSLQCPQYGCSVSIDVGTMLTFVNVRDCIRYGKSLHSRDVTNDQLRKWCPNYKCKRVLLRASDRIYDVQCLCGHRVCFNCLAKPHWPLSCEGYAKYAVTVLDRGKIVAPQEFIVKFDCKMCRLCYSVVSKYDSCMIPRCLCSNRLCRKCGLYWHQKHSHDKPGSLSDSGRVNFRIKSVETDLFSITKLYKWTSFVTQHRIHQHPFRIQKLIANSKFLSNKIRHFLLRESQHPSTSLDFNVVGEVFCHEADKADKFIEHFINVYSEINSVLEHAGVMLDVDPSIGHSKAELQHYILKLSNNTNVLCSLFRNGNFQRTGRLLESFKDVYSSNRHLLDSFVAKMKEIR